MALGFLLTGGTSSRMRRPKALLPWYLEDAGSHRAVNLAEHLCEVLNSVCSNVSLIGDVALEVTGVPRLSDAIKGAGPLGGLLRALQHPGDPGRAEDQWRLVLSCDTPLVTQALLGDMLAQAEFARAIDGTEVVLPAGPDGRIHPLCAVYHASVASRLQALLDPQSSAPVAEAHSRPSGRAPSMQSFVRLLRVHHLALADDRLLRNLNTMQDYLAALRDRGHTDSI